MYRVFGYFYSRSGNCELYYLNGFGSHGTPLCFGRAKAKLYKTEKGAKDAVEKWKDWIIGNGVSLNGDKIQYEKVI